MWGMQMKHHEWLQHQLDARHKNRGAPEIKLSPLGKRVAQIIGTVWAGIYHLEQNAYLHERTKWDDAHCIRIVFRGTLSTVDFNDLTKLVVLCHDYCVRCEIVAKAPCYLELAFSHRERETTSLPKHWYTHPTIEEALAPPENKSYAWRPTPEEVKELE